MRRGYGLAARPALPAAAERREPRPRTYSGTAHGLAQVWADPLRSSGVEYARPRPDRVDQRVDPIAQLSTSAGSATGWPHGHGPKAGPSTPGTRRASCDAAAPARLLPSALSELPQRCRPRVRTASVIDVMRFGLHRDPRKTRQDSRRATPRSTGALAAARARLTVFSVRVSSCRAAFDARGQPGSAALVGEIGQDGDALALTDADDSVGAGGGQVVSASRQRG